MQLSETESKEEAERGKLEINRVISKEEKKEKRIDALITSHIFFHRGKSGTLNGNWVLKTNYHNFQTMRRTLPNLALK